MASVAPRRQFLLSLALLSASALTLAAGVPRAGDALADRIGRHFVESIEPSGFSGAILVALGDEVLLRRACGLANREEGLENQPQTRFRIGSISKQFTAALVLRQSERGLLALDDLAGEYWQETPAQWSEVTLRHLLQHTSGIHSVTDLPDFGTRLMGQPLRPAQQLANVTALPLDFAPGTEWRYSNSGYLLLALAAEQVGGKRFEDLLAEEILRPLELSSTGSESSAGEVALLARGYERRRDGPIEPAAFIDMNVPTGAGGLYSTVDDLLRWARAIERRELLAPASWEAMLEPGLGDYGLGVMVQERHGLARVSHGGGINGFLSWLALYPERGAVVVVFSNLADESGPQTLPQAIGESLEAMVLAAEPVAAGR